MLIAIFQLYLQPIERWWRTGRQLGMQYFMDFFNSLEMAGQFETGNATDL